MRYICFRANGQQTFEKRLVHSIAAGQGVLKAALGACGQDSRGRLTGRAD